MNVELTALEAALANLPPNVCEAVRWVVAELRRFLHPVEPAEWTASHLRRFESERLPLLPEAARVAFAAGLAVLFEHIETQPQGQTALGRRDASGDTTRGRFGSSAATGRFSSTQRTRRSLPDLRRSPLGVQRTSPNDS